MNHFLSYHSTRIAHFPLGVRSDDMTMSDTRKPHKISSGACLPVSVRAFDIHRGTDLVLRHCRARKTGGMDLTSCEGVVELVGPSEQLSQQTMSRDQNVCSSHGFTNWSGNGRGISSVRGSGTVGRLEGWSCCG
jgi:hypothetical protein